MIIRPTLPPVKDYVEVEYNGERVYKSIKTGLIYSPSDLSQQKQYSVSSAQIQKFSYIGTGAGEIQLFFQFDPSLVIINGQIIENPASIITTSFNEQNITYNVVVIGY